MATAHPQRYVCTPEKCHDQTERRGAAAEPSRPRRGVTADNRPGVALVVKIFRNITIFPILCHLAKIEKKYRRFGCACNWPPAVWDTYLDPSPPKALFTRVLKVPTSILPSTPASQPACLRRQRSPQTSNAPKRLLPGSYPFWHRSCWSANEDPPPHTPAYPSAAPY